MSRQAGGGYCGTFGFRRRIALQGSVAATVTPVALLCATEVFYGAESSNCGGWQSIIKASLPLAIEAGTTRPTTDTQS